MSKKKKCYNCQFAGKQFKIGNLTHLHCFNPEKFPPKKMEAGEISPWDSLCVFSEFCEKHKFKDLAELGV